MSWQSAFQRCLRDMDIAGVRTLWQHFAPQLPQPKDDAEALATLHHARTQAEFLPNQARYYSHDWLTEHNLPSGLPDRLKSERPQRVEAVGIAVKALGGREELAKAIENAMAAAVAECYADGQRDPEIVKERMARARAIVEKY
jgi:hypothetical protein